MAGKSKYIRPDWEHVDGNLIPNINNTYDIGSGDTAFKNLYLSGFIDLSGISAPSSNIGVIYTGIDGHLYYSSGTTGFMQIDAITLENGNGITANGLSVDLGGTLTSTTSILGNSGAYSLYLGTAANHLYDLAIYTDNGILFRDNTGGGIYLDSYGAGGIYIKEYDGGGILILDDAGGGVSIEATNNGGLLLQGDNSYIYIDSTAIEITDTDNSKGLIYSADYSTNYTDRSLVDKAYVDTAISNSGGTLLLTPTYNYHTSTSLINVSGSNNIAIGDSVGNTLTSGNENIFLGYQFGYELTTGTGNIFLGKWSGSGTTNTNLNIFIGESAGRYSNGGDNIAIGAGAMYN